jgi:trans-o-hydroxybenzylidenepyruvate hydratase-aldolase
MVEPIKGRVPYFCGTTSLNTRETVKQTKEAYDIGADGTMLGLPMWQICDTKTAVRFYQDVAEAVPDMSIAIYANPEAFKYDFPRPFWAQVAEIPQVVTCKYIGVASLYMDLMLTKGKIRFLPIDMDYVPAAKIDPENITAFWTSGTNCGPLPAIQLRDEVIKAKQTGDWGKATELQNAILHTAQTLFPNGSFKEFSTYNVQLEKARFNAGGWMNAGPARPPYRFDSVPEAYLEGARESGRRWSALHKKLSQQGS